MAVTPQPAFTVDSSVGMSAGITSSNVALPGTLADDTVVRIVNLGPGTAYVALGSSSVAATTQNLCIPPGQVQYLAINSNTYLAAITTGAGNAQLNISTGN